MIEHILQHKTAEGLKALYGIDAEAGAVQLQKTRKDFEGDYTIVVFPFLKQSRKDPQTTANEIGEYLVQHVAEVADFNIIKGFLNIRIRDNYWINHLMLNKEHANYGKGTAGVPHKYVVEYSSPNTNKPLHLGHIRNNLLGWSVSEILSFAGHEVIKVNLVNDRGIHICKSMLAWQKWGRGETPESTGMKGDLLVGKYYVMFETHYKAQRDELIAQGQTEEEAAQRASLMAEARDMLQRWENNDTKVRTLWQNMNRWVLDGFEQTYKKLGIDFDKTYFESETYLLGKDIVSEGLKNNVFYKRADNSVWVDLSGDGLDEKLLLRADGTSVYMTQDLGTAQLRYEDFKADKYIYVVGNEQNYHFDVLKLVLKKLGREWADGLLHLSYGMVELPEGKMKSREGKVVDADDLMADMVLTAREHTEALGKLEGFTTEEAAQLFETLALGALKYFILKVDPKKNMIFNPLESIDLNGNTGPFIQYSYVRINSLLKKAADSGLDKEELNLQILNINEKEKYLLKLAYDFPALVTEAAEYLSPALIANYLYELAREFNQFYHDFSVLHEPDRNKAAFRLQLSAFTGNILKTGLGLLGIGVPDRM